MSEPWILDVDTTVKPLYGHQEGAVVGYNPKKPGRPSHCYHTYSMAGTRLVLDVDVSAGDEHTSHHSAPGLWALLDRTPRDCWPSLLRGDKGFGNEGIRDLDEAVAAAGRVAELDRLQIRRQFEQRFSIERVAREYLRIYRSLPGVRDRLEAKGKIRILLTPSPTVHWVLRFSEGSTSARTCLRHRRSSCELSSGCPFGPDP